MRYSRQHSSNSDDGRQRDVRTGGDRDTALFAFALVGNSEIRTADHAAKQQCFKGLAAFSDKNTIAFLSQNKGGNIGGTSPETCRTYPVYEAGSDCIHHHSGQSGLTIAGQNASLGGTRATSSGTRLFGYRYSTLFGQLQDVKYHSNGAPL